MLIKISKCLSIRKKKYILSWKRTRVVWQRTNFHKILYKKKNPPDLVKFFIKKTMNTVVLGTEGVWTRFPLSLDLSLSVKDN